MIADKLHPHGAQSNPLRAPVLSPSGPSQPREQHAAICHARPADGAGLRRDEVIDEDLGRSAAGGVQRAGFERMVAEVCLGKVGAVCAREVSRFARSSRGWQQLIEMCRVVDTVLVDQETIYAPRRGNDRLLLGLKGSLNEYELDLLRQRSLSARYEKARRFER
jgi:DNA invertase Pin-like site-specific DNA recombinase